MSLCFGFSILIILLILASASIARHRLLKQAGIKHQVIISDVDEMKFQHDVPTELVKCLAIEKAKAVSEKIFSDNHLLPSDGNQIRGILGCDSLFEFQGEIFGKPIDANEAAMRWEKMSARSGLLHTGHALMFWPSKFEIAGWREENRLICECVSTCVKFAGLTKSEINDYVATGEPMQCAGGFALEGEGAKFIESINGCYSNVLGLSLPWLRKTFLEVDL